LKQNIQKDIILMTCQKIKKSLQEMLYFARGRNPGKMQKTLAKVRLPGVLPGAGSPAN